MFDDTGVKEGYFLKSGYFTAMTRQRENGCGQKGLQTMLIIRSAFDELFSGASIDEIR